MSVIYLFTAVFLTIVIISLREDIREKHDAGFELFMNVLFSVAIATNIHLYVTELA